MKENMKRGDLCVIKERAYRLKLDADFLPIPTERGIYHEKGDICIYFKRDADRDIIYGVMHIVYNIMQKQFAILYQSEFAPIEKDK